VERPFAVPLGKGECMTKYFIDDKEIEVSAKFSSFEQFLKYVEVSHLISGRIVRRIYIDGQLFSHEDLNHGSVSYIETKGKIEIFTSTIGEVSKESIEEAKEYLARVERLAPALCAKFQDFPDADAFQDLRNLYEGYYVINVLLEKLSANYCLKFEDIFVRNVSIQEHLQKFISVLKQLIECKQNRDVALVADILEYEILPGVPIWKEIFDVVQKKITMMQ
jgi:hypothetical protein